MSRILQTYGSAAASGSGPAGQEPVRRAGATAVEVRVFDIALGLAMLHAVDDAVLGRQPGVPVGQHLPALAVAVVVALAALLGFHRSRPGIRAGIAIAVGLLTATNGAMHVIHVWVDGVSGSDLSGVLAAVAGAVLVGLGAAIPYLHRGEGARSRTRRWVNRGIAVITAAVLVVFVLLPVAVGIGQTHKFREPVGAQPAGFRDVSFESTDGLMLAGWYAPSENGAAVVVVSSAGGDRTRTAEHAALLAAHGYGVLAYDARGSGESEGSPNGYGWAWDRDVRGAIAFLQRQPDVDPDRIGGLGLSTGADVLIEVAAEDHVLGAVVADGATGRSFDDLLPGTTSEAPAFWMTFSAVELLSGTSPGAPLEELAAQVSPTPLLLIAAGSLPSEPEFNAIYAEVGGEAVDLWNLPDVTHTAAISEEAEAYERRVIGHFDLALLEPDGSG